MKPGIFLQLAIFQFSCLGTLRAQVPHSPGYGVQYDSAYIQSLVIPEISRGEKIYRHTAYWFSYNELHEQANWVAYELTKEETISIVERTNNFRPDPIVETGTATKADYEKMGYDRGHLSPAADNGWSQIAMSESFYFSNMSPQDASFNRGIWRILEDKVRHWAAEKHSIIIVTGPVLTMGLPTIGLNKVSVPKYYYKVILEYQSPIVHSIGFLMRNEGSEKPLEYFAVPVDSIEKITGINFFPGLPDDAEKIVESKFFPDFWNWNSSGIDETHEEQETVLDTPVRCIANTKSGSQCKRMTTNSSMKCYQHE